MHPEGHSEYGDREAVMGNAILITEVGSGLHGIAVEGTDDHDEMGVYIEPAPNVIGLGGAVDHYTWRTQPEGHRSRHGDTDLVMYSLRKFAALAAKGNPSVLLPLWAPSPSVYLMTDLGAELRGLRDAFLSRQLLQRCLGFLDGQLKELRGDSRKRNHRPELIERYGYDVKAASHALRLGLQGIELGEHARLTLPMPEADRERVRAMKTGAHATLADALDEIETVRAQLVTLTDHGTAKLPERANVEGISAWMIDAHLRHWNGADTSIKTGAASAPVHA